MLQSLFNELKLIPKKAIVNLYWKYCWEVDPHNFNLLQKVYVTEMTKDTETRVYIAFLVDQAKKQGMAATNVFVFENNKLVNPPSASG